MFAPRYGANHSALVFYRLGDGKIEKTPSLAAACRYGMQEAMDDWFTRGATNGISPWKTLAVPRLDIRFGGHARWFIAGYQVATVAADSMGVIACDEMAMSRHPCIGLPRGDMRTERGGRQS